MNIYVVVEGRGDKRVYKEWIPMVNSSLAYVEDLSQISNNNFIIFEGGGYPYYRGVIESAIDDVNTDNSIDKLVVSADSEEMSFQDKHDELLDLVSSKWCRVPVIIVVQHFCLETWALGNSRVCPTNPCNAKLQIYKRFFDVRTSDPELLPEYPSEKLNRAQFSERYLRTVLVERNPRIGYSKANPKALLSDRYFAQVKARLEVTGHIASFSNFITAFH